MAEPKYNIGDRVRYTNVYGYAHTYLIKSRSSSDTGYYYELIIPNKDGSMPKVKKRAYFGIYESDILPINLPIK